MNLVTVIICAYNQEKYIKETLDSVLNQTYKGIDVFVIDDGSTDGTLTAIHDYIPEFDKKDIQLSIYHMEDVGATNARHVAILDSNTPYYVPLDGDDLLDETFLEKTLSLMVKNPDKAFVYTDTIYFGDTNHRFYQHEYSFFNLVFQNYICYASLFCKDAYLACGGYNLKNRNYHEDWELSIRLGRKGFYGIHLPEPLFKYRTRKDSISGGMGGLDRVYRAYMVTQYPELYPDDMIVAAKEIMSKYPDNFMSLKTKEQRGIFNG